MGCGLDRGEEELVVLSSVEELPSPARSNTFSQPPYGFIFEGEAKLIFPGKRGMPAGVHACVCVHCTSTGTTTGAKVKPQVSLLNIHIIVLFYLSLVTVSLSEEKILSKKKIFVDATPRASVSSICRVSEPMLLYN